MERRRGGVPPRLRRRRHALRKYARPGHCADSRWPPRRSDCAAGKISQPLSRPRAGAFRPGGGAAADRQARRSRGTVSQGADAQSALRRGPLQPGRHVPRKEGSRQRAPVRRDALRDPARFADGHRGPGRPGLSGRRLRRRREALPHACRGCTRPFRTLVQPGRGVSQNGQLRKGRPSLQAGRQPATRQRAGPPQSGGDAAGKQRSGGRARQL